MQRISAARTVLRRGARAASSNPELQEFSVVYSDRALNHMSPTFIGVMQGLSKSLKTAYNATSVAVVPGSGSYAMEAAARQFAQGKKALVIRNGFFSFRWSQIFDSCGIASSVDVMNARPVDDSAEPAFTPPPIDEVVARIRAERPGIVFAPHVETSAGIVLPDAYIKSLADAAHEVGALFLLDCIASGTLWVDMKALGVDVLLSAPQKGWSGPPSAGLVMLSENARAELDRTESSSFVLNLKTWTTLMETYENGGHMYHCTMPTEALRTFHDVVVELEEFGYEKAKAAQQQLGDSMREMVGTEFGYKSVAAEGFGAPPVLVSYGPPSLVGQFKDKGLQIAGGVPLKVGEPEPFQTFRFGFFGLDKLRNPDKYVDNLRNAMKAL